MGPIHYTFLILIAILKISIDRTMLFCYFDVFHQFCTKQWCKQNLKLYTQKVTIPNLDPLASTHSTAPPQRRDLWAYLSAHFCDIWWFKQLLFAHTTFYSSWDKQYFDLCIFLVGCWRLKMWRSIGSHLSICCSL